MRGTRQNKINTRSLGIIICIYAIIIIKIRKNTRLLSANGKNSPSNWPRAPPGLGLPAREAPPCVERENLESVSHFDPSSITTYAAHMTLLYQQHEKTPPPLERGSYLKAHCPNNIYHFCQKHLRGGRRVWMTMWQKSILIERRIKRCWNFCVFSMFV